jgi:REP element-mobilizing transposase RayT
MSKRKFYRSVGNVTADTIKHYIKESQKNRNLNFTLLDL